MPQPRRPSDVKVLVLNRQRRRRVSPPRLAAVIRRAAARLEVSGEVSLVLSNDRFLRPLNARYRGKDKATDVLSFPAEGAPGPELGDIVISVETAERNAKGLGRTLAQELDVLALHGFLHVLGYDHETDDGTMDRLERRLRRALLAPAGARA